jgi:D-arginine dehydrogenase
VTQDFCIIGGGIAGLSVAAGLASAGRVSLIEREPQLAYHATGRSAALFIESYGNSAIQALTRASRDFYFNPPTSFSPVPLTTKRGVCYIATASQRDALKRAERELSQAGLRYATIDGAELGRRVPILDGIVGAVVDLDARDMDVGAIVAGYRRCFRELGGQVITSAAVESARFDGDTWTVCAGSHTISSRILVNAAGAWADEVAKLAGALPLGLQPFRRCAALTDLPPVEGARDWPCVIDVDERFYFKPDAGRLLLSGAEETRSLPCDAEPDDMELAMAVDRIERVSHLRITRLTGQWAGLRTFAPDRTPVIGFDGRVANFFWFAGLGGYGIQTAPAASQLAAAQLMGAEPPTDLAASVRQLAPQRLRDHVG